MKKPIEEAWENQRKSWGFKSEEEYREHEDKERAELFDKKKDKQGKIICILGLIVICLIGAVLL